VAVMVTVLVDDEARRSVRNSASTRGATVGKLKSHRGRPSHHAAVSYAHTVNSDISYVPRLAESRRRKAQSRRSCWGVRVLCGTPAIHGGMAASRRGAATRGKRLEERVRDARGNFSGD
jgi:hypothetical protein